MKRLAILTTSTLIALAGGIWFGFHWRNPPMDWDVGVFVTCGGGDYPKEAFLKVNNEIDAKIDFLIGDQASDEVFLAVIPEASGYRIRAAGDSGSKLFDEPIKNQLSDWVDQRMNEIQREELQQADAVQNLSLLPSQKPTTPKLCEGVVN